MRNFGPPPFKQFFVFGPHLLGCPGQDHDGQNLLASQFLQFASEEGFEGGRGGEEGGGGLRWEGVSRGGGLRRGRGEGVKGRGLNTP